MQQAEQTTFSALLLSSYEDRAFCHDLRDGSVTGPLQSNILKNVSARLDEPITGGVQERAAVNWVHLSQYWRYWQELFGCLCG